MKRLSQLFVILCLGASLLACAAISRVASTSTPSAEKMPVAEEQVPTAEKIPTSSASAYDPTADPAVDLQKAISQAQKENKRILIEVGGEWCVWCHIMDRFYDTHPELLKLREDHYILLKVNYSEENQNQAFLSNYPEIPGYPHIFILESDGTLLHSQNTSALEQGQSYNEQRFTSFLADWAR